MPKLFREDSEKNAIVELLNDLAAANRPGECFEAFSRAVAAVGFDGVAFVRRSESVQWRESITECTYPQEWVRRYVAMSYAKIDPARRFCFRTGDVFFWEDTYKYYRKKELVIFDEAREYGLRSGMATPIYSAGTLVGVVGLASKAPKLDDPRLKPFVRMSTSLFHAAYVQLASGDAAPVDPLPQMTKREMEIINLLSEGNANTKIATDLSIGLGSVEYHIANIFKKLDVDNRVAAVVRAIRLGLIDI
jgi:DNA-binding CsgD family transcriptional regulator